jgi:hypothetical protein
MPDGQLITAHDAIMAHLTTLLPDSRFARRGRGTGMGQLSDMAFMVSGPVRACQSLSEPVLVAGLQELSIPACPTPSATMPKPPTAFVQLWKSVHGCWATSSAQLR